MKLLGNFFKIGKNLILIGLISIIFLVILSFLPITRDYLKIFVVQSGSMEPAIKTGSLILVTFSDVYQIGDVVTRKTNNQEMTVTHRIVGRTEEGKYITKGDANESEDSREVEEGDILGKVFLKIPYLGYLINYSRTTLGFILIIIVPAGVIVFEELRKIRKEFKRKSGEEDKKLEINQDLEKNKKN